MSDKKKFRKRKEDESRWHYLNFLLLTFWPLTLLAQIVVSSICFGIFWLVFKDMETALAFVYATIPVILVIIFTAIANHYKAKPWGEHIAEDPCFVFLLLLFNIGIISCTIYGVLSY